MARSGKRGINPGGILSTQEAATVLGVSHPTLLKLLKEKRIPEPPLSGVSRCWSGADIQHAQVVLNQMAKAGELRRKGGRK
jgi:excisionase family DNA binding protein